MGRLKTYVKVNKEIKYFRLHSTERYIYYNRRAMGPLKTYVKEI